MNIGLIIYILGFVLMFLGGFFTLPAIVALIYSEPTGWYFVILSVVSLLIGLVVTRFKPKRYTFFARDGFVAVALSWIMLSIIGALPFYLSGEIENFVDAVFETVSGFTTTGASILPYVEDLSKCMIFWRSFTHFVGGMGVLVFILAIVPMAGGSNVMLMKAESPGPISGKLVPKVRTTAFYLYLIYVVMMFIEIIILLIAGMDPFDAITISFGSAGTGGFAVRNDGFMSYTPFMQSVVTFSMLLFGINFTAYYLIITKKFKQAIKSEEVWVYLFIFALSSIVIAKNTLGEFSNFGESLHHAAFQVSSVMTTTGYSTVDYDLWPSLSKTILVCLMFIGACGGSTGGGIKVSRIIIAIKASMRSIKQCIHPRSVKAIKMDGKVIEEETVASVTVYFILYAFIFFISLLFVSIDNFDFTTNFTAVAATFNNIGPGLNGVGPTQNFSAYSAFSKIVFILDMLIGRLELFPVLILFSRSTWKKN